MFNGTYTDALVRTTAAMPDLNWLERSWAAYYSWVGSDIIATGLLSFIFHEVTYFGRAIPWIIIDAMPSVFNKYKLQPGKVPSAAEQWECTKHVLISHFAAELPLIFLFHPICEYFGLEWGVPFPKLTTMAWQIAIFFVMEDSFHYWAHRGLHHGAIYKHVHKLHHKYSAPFGLAAEFAHPLETLVLGIGTVGSPILFSAVFGSLHLFTMYVWITLRLFQAIDAHSGYDFPWSLNKLIPFWAGAEHHDYHHERTVNCFASSLRINDWLFATDKHYIAYRSAQAARKAGLKAELDAGKKVA